MINVFQPALGSEELAAVERVFSSNWIGKGQITARFESDFAAFLGVERQLIRSTTCCTEALFQSMALLEIQPGDEVILPTISFVGAANAIAASGARPVFCDVDPLTLNATASLIEAKITPRTRAVIILHYGGVPSELDGILDLLSSRRIPLIEDSACSPASRYRGRACGTFGEIGTWSFDAMKILVTGDGGMLYCRSAELAQRAEESCYLGLRTQSGFSAAVDRKWWEFSISGPGRRAIMNDVTAAIGVEQLKKLPGSIGRRREIHARYEAELADVGWLRRPPAIPPYVESSYYFYWIQTAPEIRDQLAAYLRDREIYTTFRYFPLHRVDYYRTSDRLPNAEAAAETTLCIPLHQSLSDGDVEQVVGAIRQFQSRTMPASLADLRTLR